MKVAWIELPVKNLERAITFYQTVFPHLTPSPVYDEPVRRTCVLTRGGDHEEPGISLTQTDGFTPSSTGTYIYVDTGADDLTPAMQRVEPAGGKLLSDKVSMGDAGNYAAFLDTEGNLLALYSVK